MTGSPPSAVAATPLELRIERGRVSVGSAVAALPDGATLVDLELDPTVLPSPFDPGAGTASFRSIPCSLRRLIVATSGPAPGHSALERLLSEALAPHGWPVPDTGGLVHSTWSDARGAGSRWDRPSDRARALLAEGAAAAARGDGDAPIRLALAGHAALACGLSPEGEEALRGALRIGLGPDDAREAWGALVTAAGESGDATAERQALAGLARAAPTGERPALLLRLARLDLAAGDLRAGRIHAEEARTLAPRDPEATEACLDVALRAGDAPGVIDLLGRLATLAPDRAGELLLDRARRLAAATRRAEADESFREALARLPADRALADEHAAFRRSAPSPVGDLPWGEPLEAFAARATDPREAARAFRDAALLARGQADTGSALRAARRAHQLAGDPGFAGELLAGLLHEGGSSKEALDLHRQLLADGASVELQDLPDRLAALADLAEEAGDRALAVSSLDRLLDLRPHDAGALEWRFRLDPDRSGGASRLLQGVGALRSRRDRARLAALAGDTLLDGVLHRLRDRPSDLDAAREVTALARGLAGEEPLPWRRAALGELAALADGLVRFGERQEPALLPLALAPLGGATVRARVAVPGADGPTARLLALLSPFLEPLFPADLARHGVALADRITSSSSPAVHQAFEEARAALAGRPLALFASPQPGLQGAIENTRPPALLLGLDAVALPPGALAFLAARSVALVDAGWVLVGRFTPRDTGILCELASRFAAGEPPPLGLPSSRAGDFLDALARAVPAAVIDAATGLGPASASELATLDPAVLGEALERTADRVALLHTGDLQGALSVLARLTRPGSSPSDPRSVIDRPDAVALVRFALSPTFVELRGMLLGWT